jgi:hypothetical protein
VFWSPEPGSFRLQTLASSLMMLGGADLDKAINGPSEMDRQNDGLVEAKAICAGVPWLAIA